MQSIDYLFLRFKSIVASDLRTHEHEDFEILLVVVHDVRHETEPSQSHHLAESR